MIAIMAQGQFIPVLLRADHIVRLVHTMQYMVVQR